MALRGSSRLCGVKRTLVALVVGLSESLIGEDTPAIRALAERGWVAPIDPVLPAVTCTAQATYVTGLPPSGHGVVGNGWYWRDRAEVAFWKQSNALVQGPKLWDLARERDPAFTCATMFWWFNMFADVEWSVTPRPIYHHDGRKGADVYAGPPELRARLNRELGRFPLFRFWGPATSIESTRWIVDATLRVLAEERPTLTLAYLPHLDYDLQRYGPSAPQSRRALREVDAEVGRLIEVADRDGLELILLSEYGIEPVSRPVHLNRVLREAGFLVPWLNDDRWELLEPGACRAFAVADHQVAHVYVRRPADLEPVRALLARTPGVAQVLAGEARGELDHPRAGELVCVAEPGAWFTYYYWLDDALAPDFARCVEIHKKPGYDPCELFLDPARRAPKLHMAWKLLRKILGFRSVFDVIGLDPSLVGGSHGRPPSDPADGAVFVSGSAAGARSRVAPTEVQGLILERVFAGQGA
ncbi:MAG: alkaline phosphatase family protein [Planctomycetes bacterium]|nr:alkaline phosphatase family protein [Planctomycetota bacterium]